jgi:D-alanine-D-alanine ligase
VALDKTMTKRIWQTFGLPTAAFQEFTEGDEPLAEGMRFPMFVKPAREGTGMGMDAGAVVFSEKEMRRRVDWVITNYRQPALVEEFLPGREFTVAVMGRKDAAHYTLRPDLYASDGFHRFPILEVDNSRSITPGIYGNAAKTLHWGDDGMPGIICPAPVDPLLAAQLCNLAIQAHNALGALDISRVDIRLDIDGQPRLLEINTLPGLTPDFSDLCVIANGENLSYRDLILEILYLAASRYGMVTQRMEAIEIPEMVPVHR